MAIFNSYSDITRGYQLEHAKKTSNFQQSQRIGFCGSRSSSLPRKTLDLLQKSLKIDTSLEIPLQCEAPQWCERWFISPSNYKYIPHKPWLLELLTNLAIFGASHCTNFVDCDSGHVWFLEGKLDIFRCCHLWIVSWQPIFGCLPSGQRLHNERERSTIFNG